MGDEFQDIKDALLETGDPLTTTPVINRWDLIKFEETLDGKSTGELALEMLHEAKALRLKAMTKCVSLGPSKNLRVQNNNNENSDNLNKYLKNIVKIAS
jgi:hypothetical protein